MIRAGGMVMALSLVAAVASAKTKAAPKKPDPVKAVKAVIKKHVEAFRERGSGGETTRDDWSWYQDDAEFFVEAAEEGGLGSSSLEDFLSGGPLLFTWGGTVKAVKVVVAADGQAAWATFSAQGPGICIHDDCTAAAVFRATELLVKIDAEWKLLSGFWSMGQADKAAHAAAMDGSAPVPAALLEEGEEVSEGPAELLEGIAAPLRKGAAFIDVISERADLEIFGSAPGERTAGGKALRKAWKAWAPTLTVHGRLKAGLAPSGTVGWVVANLKLGKTKGKQSYSLYVRAFFVCEKGKDGWRVVSAHLAVPVSGESIREF